MDDGLMVEVVDDGIGLPPDWVPGIGITSMRERAAELGGSCTIESVPGGGTRIVVRLPLGEGAGDRGQGSGIRDRASAS